LVLLAGAGLIPGAEASVVETGSVGVRVRGSDGEQTVPFDVARLTFVEVL
jgi:hypothetical protein